MKKIYSAALIALFLISAVYSTGYSQDLSADSVKVENNKKGNGNLEKSSPKKVTSKPSKKIAITFDNLPGDRIYTAEERSEINQGILEALKKHKAPATGFVIGEYVEGEDWESIVNWLENGQTIGFHTYTGQEIQGIPLDIFISDIIKGKEAVEDLVSTYKQQARYFRYPYLHYPTDARSKMEIIDQLIKMNVRIAHVSIITEDFVYNMSLEKTFKMGDSLDLLYLKKEYLDHISEQIAHYEDLANEVVGRVHRCCAGLSAPVRCFRAMNTSRPSCALSSAFSFCSIF